MLECTLALQTALLAEHEALRNSHLAQLDKAAHNKQTQLTRLEALETERQQLLNESGWQDVADARHPQLDTLWEAIVESLGDCQRSNEVNGAMVRSHHARTQQALGILSGARTDTYAADGTATSQPSTGAIAKA